MLSLTAESCELFNIPFYQFAQMKKFCPEDIPAIKALETENPEFAAKIHPRHPNTVAEVVWAVREEMAESVEDVLARRVRLLFLDARAAIDSAAKVANIIAKELNKDAQWERDQTAKFLDIAKHYLLVDYAPQVA
mgnify:CR=1 FL=1